MKKFMKAIAFVTVMCMALSTVAFAAGSLGEATEENTFTVTVTGAGTDQVALLVVEKDANRTTATPLYIDQKPATDGTAVFTAKIAKNVAAVDVYVGYATYAAEHNEALMVGTVELVQPTTEITITKVAVESVKGVQAEADLGDAYAFTFTATAPDGVIATDMVWAISYTDKAGNSDTVYSEAIDISSYLIGAGTSGAVTLGVAFSNGSVVRPIEAVTIDSVDAIFLFNDADKTEITTDNKNFTGDYEQK